MAAPKKKKNQNWMGLKLVKKIKNKNNFYNFNLRKLNKKVISKLKKI